MTNAELDKLDEQVARLRGWKGITDHPDSWHSERNPEDGGYDQEWPRYTRDRSLVGELVDALTEPDCTLTSGITFTGRKLNINAPPEMDNQKDVWFGVIGPELDVPQDVDYQVGLCLALVELKGKREAIQTEE